MQKPEVLIAWKTIHMLLKFHEKLIREVTQPWSNIGDQFTL